MNFPDDHPQPAPACDALNWVHFGDLHLTGEREQNYQDLLALVAHANAHLSGPGGVDFAFLPGDNADNGTEAQYRLLRRALDGLRLPVHALPGDHDIQTGNLHQFRRWLEPVLTRSLVFGDYRCVFLNSVDIEGKEGFDLGEQQLAYLDGELDAAARAGQKTILFMHTFPSELGHTGKAVMRLIHRHAHVRLVEMGHTHYNEIANDGRVIYAATRSTGQVEESPVGFSVTCLDGDVVSWKFKALIDPWPLVMITSPADRLFLTAALQPVRGTVVIRARAWCGNGGVVCADCRVDDGMFEPMTRAQESTITVLCDQTGHYDPPARSAVDLENSIGCYPEKGLLGTQLGPNKNGHPWAAS